MEDVRVGGAPSEVPARSQRDEPWSELAHLLRRPSTMSRSTVRLATSGALSAVLLATLGGVVADRSSGTSPAMVRVQPGQQVSVSARVPVAVKAKVAGRS